MKLFSLENKNIYGLLSIHLAAGLLYAILPKAVVYWQVFVIIFGLINIIGTSDRGGIAAVWSAYISGMEVLVRMTGEGLVWELSKYCVVLFLATGILVSERRFSLTYIVYFLLLVPSVFVASYANFDQARDMISFNLSGPLCLAVSGLYFYKRPIYGGQFIKVLRALILPIISMLSYLIVEVPSIRVIAFGSRSNFEASGGFGPNQVSLILGFTIFLLVVLMYYRTSFSGSLLFDFLLVAILLYRALITFSRGGVVGAALSVVVFIVLSQFGRIRNRQTSNLLATTLLLGVTAIFIWNYVNSSTDNALEYRYKGINTSTGREQDYSSGRLLIMERDIYTFINNPFLGVGPGMGKLQTYLTRRDDLPAHTEWTRLLAEHGVLGLMAIFVLILLPLLHITSCNQNVRGLLIGLFVISVFSMFHAAMRLSIISFVYGLALIYPASEERFVRRK